MEGKRYPLQTAQRLRHGEQPQAEGALAVAVRALERAQQSRADAEQALNAHLAGMPTAASVDLGAAQSAIDVQRAAAFAQRTALTTRRLRAVLDAADVTLARSQAAVAEAQQALARAHGRAQVIDRDRARFEQDAQRSAREAEWSELDDQLAYRKRERR